MNNPPLTYFKTLVQPRLPGNVIFTLIQLPRRRLALPATGETVVVSDKQQAENVVKVPQGSTSVPLCNLEKRPEHQEIRKTRLTPQT